MKNVLFICLSIAVSGCLFDPSGAQVTDQDGADGGVIGDAHTDGGFSDGNEAQCGNGILEPGEECDNGAENDDFAADACRTNCKEPSCGDGVVDSDEECDYGELNSDSEPNMCRTVCVKAFCGDGVVDNLEQCDDGPENSDTIPDACSTECELPYCGDGKVDPNEQCDEGSGNSDTDPDACRTSCKWAHCGDGVVDSGEECDDNNVDDGDNCSSTCLVFPRPIDESGWACFEEDIDSCDGIACSEDDSLNTCHAQENEGCIAPPCIHLYSGDWGGYCGIGGVHQTVTIPDAPGVFLYAKIDTSCDKHAHDGGIIVNDGLTRTWLVKYYRTDVNWEEQMLDVSSWRNQSVTLEVAIEDQSDSWCNASDHSYRLKADLLEFRQFAP